MQEVFAQKQHPEPINWILWQVSCESCQRVHADHYGISLVIVIHWWLMLFHDVQRHIGQPRLHLNSRKMLSVRYSIGKVYILYLLLVMIPIFLLNLLTTGWNDSIVVNRTLSPVGPNLTEAEHLERTLKIAIHPANLR